METEREIISSEAKLSAIAGLLFFAPFVKNRINFEDFSDTERILFIDMLRFDI